MRVAHLLATMDIGGRERIVADLCRSAPGLGIEPLIITYDRPTPRAGRIEAPGVPVIALDRRHPGFRADLRCALGATGVDVLHAHGHVPAALAAGATGAVPMLASMHIALGSGWRWLVPVVRGLRQARQVTAVSEDLARRYRFWAGRPITVVPTGVDLRRFVPPAQDRVPGDTFTVGLVARLHPVKRIDVAVRALHLLRQRGLRCRLVVAGEGACRPQLASLARDGDVVLAGAVRDVPAWLGALDAFVLTSDHEGTPAALLEAMASGLPCIATRVGGVPALLGQAGMLVPRRDPIAVADAVQALMADDGLRRQLGVAAARRARCFSVERQAQAYARIYAGIVAEPYQRR